MRIWLLALVLCSCGNKSKLDMDRGADVDALWDLAPDGTEVGIVASPRAIDFVMRGVSAARGLAAMPDFAPMKPQVDAIIAALLGRPDATPTEAGIATDRGFAMFITNDGVLGVMPVGDRDKFMKVKHGTRGDVDHLNGNSCKPMQGLYVCASNDKMFERLGKASLRGKVMLAGGRGDIELYAPKLPLFGTDPGEVALAVELDDGAIAVRAKYLGKLAGTFGQLAGVTAPHPTAAKASGFVAFDIAKLLGGLPPVPLAGDVTLDAFGKSLVGPVTAVIPSGSVDIQVHVPTTDPAPAKGVIDHCKDLAPILDLVDQQVPGVCRFRMQSASVLELEAWVDGKELRIGAHKNTPATGSIDALTPIGNELATGDWTAVFWGRGTMLNLAGIQPATIDLPPQASAAIHAIALVNELGVGLKVEAGSLTLRGVMRTTWANPPDVTAKVIAISGDDIVHGKATDTAKAIAASSPDSPFATDYATGQGGLMVPAAALGLASAVIMPRIEELLGLGGGGDGGSDAPPMPPIDDPDSP
jgi:hypothetical protein